MNKPPFRKDPQYIIFNMHGGRRDLYYGRGAPWIAMDTFSFNSVTGVGKISNSAGLLLKLDKAPQNCQVPPPVVLGWGKNVFYWTRS